MSPRARDASSAERWGFAGTLAAAEKWVWLRKYMYRLSGELAVLLPVQTVGLGERSPLLLSRRSSSLLPPQPNVTVSPQTPAAKG